MALVLANEPGDLWAGICAQSKQQPPVKDGKPHTTLEQRLTHMFEFAFVGISLAQRLEFLKQLLRCSKSTTLAEALLHNAPHIRYFALWLTTLSAADCQDEPTQKVRHLLTKVRVNLKEADGSSESELARLAFLAKLKPAKIESALIDQVTGRQTSTRNVEAPVNLDDINFKAGSFGKGTKATLVVRNVNAEDSADAISD